MPSQSTIVITGATRGIGEACAREFAKIGWNVIVVGRAKSELEKLAKEIKATAVIGDLTDPKTDQLILKAVGNNSLAALVNNAGIYRNKPFVDTTEADWREQFELNLFATVRLTKSLVPKLRAHGAASIVNISSSVSLRAIPGLSAYSATKAAVDIWTKTLAVELAPKIRVNAVNPGIVDTPIHSFTRAQKNDLKGAQPLGRIGEPQDVAKAVRFLVDAEWLTGVILPVDGGISLV